MLEFYPILGTRNFANYLIPPPGGGVREHPWMTIFAAPKCGIDSSHFLSFGRTSFDPKLQIVCQPFIFGKQPPVVEEKKSALSFYFMCRLCVFATLQTFPHLVHPLRSCVRFIIGMYAWILRLWMEPFQLYERTIRSCAKVNAAGI